jgi:hypothetical protein
LRTGKTFLDEVAARVVRVVIALCLVRLTVGRSDLLFQAISVGRACERVDLVGALALRVALTQKQQSHPKVAKSLKNMVGTE